MPAPSTSARAVDWRRHQKGRGPVLLVPSDATTDDIDALANTTHRDNVPRTKICILSAKNCKAFTAQMWQGLQLTRYPKLHTVDVAESSFGDEQLSMLPAVKGLSSLSLFLCPVTDEGLRVVGTLSELTKLRLAYTLITDEGLRFLADLRKLSHLELSFTKITDAGLAFLASLPELVEISVQGTGVTAVGVAPFLKRRLRVNADPLVLKS